jgi:hypothetical protein
MPWRGYWWPQSDVEKEMQKSTAKHVPKFQQQGYSGDFLIVLLLGQICISHMSLVAAILVW